ncbi:Aldehyde dehydrogenase family 9 member A1-A isoform 2 [Schistosoma japonicum]|uniref:Aldehyde dehydrogenase family 9 member A1-A isoform 2 n=3 Tax=Schistosoma japonicum TaxID=6182 RepID=A0A4Z2DWA7_SCHJA|nr:Aldehyde dehydrogenase family 9 member A1-A isoform 2 [Schistosoma japonicum]
MWRYLLSSLKFSSVISFCKILKFKTTFVKFAHSAEFSTSLYNRQRFQMNPDSYLEHHKQAVEKLHSWLIRSQLPLKSATDVRDSGLNYDYTSYDPSTWSPLVHYKQTNCSQLDEMAVNACKAQKQWFDLPSLERVKILRKVGDLVRAEANWLAELESLDTGKPLWEARADIEACADSFELFAGFIPSFVGIHSPVPPNPGSFYYTRREPFGLCAGIGAWNFPFQMAVWKSVPALAAGNSFIFKPSPLTPLTAVRLYELYKLAGCPENLFQVVLGGAEIGQALVNHPLVRKVSFTGSVEGGRCVLKCAAERIIPSTLELGGKSPLIIMSDANLDEAVKGTLMANFYTQGQVCSNAARVFVHNSIAAPFTRKLIESVEQIMIGDPFNPKVCMGALISPEHRQNVYSYIQSAISEGATLLIGGEMPHFDKVRTNLNNDNFITPCILSNCNDNMKVVKEEIFGPVITLLEFTSEDEVIQRSNNSEFGLAGGVFTQNLATAHRIAQELQCGSVYINSYNVYPPGIPFGGYKLSGFGRENSVDTLLAYSQLKSVYVEGGSLPYPFPK